MENKIKNVKTKPKKSKFYVTYDIVRRDDTVVRVSETINAVNIASLKKYLSIKNMYNGKVRNVCVTGIEAA